MRAIRPEANLTTEMIGTVAVWTHMLIYFEKFTLQKKLRVNSGKYALF